MTSSLNLGLTPDRVQMKTNYWLQSKEASMRGRYSGNYNYSGYQSSNNNTLTGSVDTYVSTKGNECTDGKDDGKIGFFSAAANIIEGAFKTTVKSVTGLFTDSEGKFSLGKTLTSVALGVGVVALTTVCAPAGLAIAGLGIASGAGNMVSGVAKALNAKTDAEAKDAWEQVGEGGVTLAASVAGAKASYNAIKTTSSVGALNSLSKGASWLDKLKALGTDAWSSTKNGATKAFESIRGLFLQKATPYTPSRAGLPSGTSELGSSSSAKALPNGMELTATAQQGTAAATQGLSKANPFGAFTNGVKQTADTASRLRNAIKLNGGDSVIRTILNNIKSINPQRILTSLTSAQQQIYSALINGNASYNQLVAQYGYENVIGVLEVFESYRMVDETV